MAEQAPRVSVYRAQTPAVAGGSDANYAIKVNEGGSVSSVSYTSIAALTGNTGQARTFNLVNKGQTGAGSTTVATLAMATGTNLVAYDEMAITLSGTPANLVVAAGDILQWQSTHAGTGVADGGGEVEVQVTRTA